jgi:ornithine cyclodeaminase
LSDEKFSVRAVENLEEAVSKSDIISCATLVREPLVKGTWLMAGQHLDLVGGFTPEMREADGAASGKQNSKKGRCYRGFI